MDQEPMDVSVTSQSSGAVQSTGNDTPTPINAGPNGFNTDQTSPVMINKDTTTSGTSNSATTSTDGVQTVHASTGNTMSSVGPSANKCSTSNTDECLEGSASGSSQCSANNASQTENVSTSTTTDIGTIAHEPSSTVPGTNAVVMDTVTGTGNATNVPDAVIIPGTASHSSSMTNVPGTTTHSVSNPGSDVTNASTNAAATLMTPAETDDDLTITAIIPGTAGVPGNAVSSTQSVVTGAATNVTRTTTVPGASATTPAVSGTASSSSLKRKQKFHMRDDNAPKPPLNSYQLFLIANRKRIRLKNPGMPFHEVTKVLGSMWSELPPDQKQFYHDQADKDKKQYMTELKKYQNSDAYKTFIAERERMLKVIKQEEKESPGTYLVCVACNMWFVNTHNRDEHLKSRKHRNVVETQARQAKKSSKQGVEGDSEKKTAANKNASTTEVNNFADMSAVAEGDLNVPVFSDAFLQYNKSRESELRSLRKATTQFEEQNAILSKHNDSLKSAIGKLEDEKGKSEQDMKRLGPFLKDFCESLVGTFSDVELPNSDVVLAESTVEDFLTKLCTVCQQPGANATVQKVKEVLKGFDYPNCLSD